jgi:hypothetical protein
VGEQVIKKEMSQFAHLYLLKNLKEKMHRLRAHVESQTLGRARILILTCS